MSTAPTEMQTYAALGRLSINFRRLEYVMGEAIGFLLDLDPGDHRLMVMTNRLRMPQLAKHLHGLATLRWGEDPTYNSLRAEFVAINTVRNRLIHGLVLPTEDGSIFTIDQAGIVNPSSPGAHLEHTTLADIEAINRRIQQCEERVVKEVILRRLREDPNFGEGAAG